MTSQKTASLVLAAGMGSRMKNFDGNKTLLPLVPDKSPYTGRHPILLQILNNLPPGPKALIINYKKEEVIRATRSFDLSYLEQPILNGTGGALLAAGKFLEDQMCDHLIITMGDVPLVSKATYHNLVEGLKSNDLVVLGFCPEDRKQYGVLEIDGNTVRRITEWKYWRTYSKERQEQLKICNSGIYAARKKDLIRYLSVLEKKPHIVSKERDGRMIDVEEFFITDLVELMRGDGLELGYVIAEEEDEVMGVDDLPTLIKAQEIFNKGSGRKA